MAVTPVKEQQNPPVYAPKRAVRFGGVEIIEVSDQIQDLSARKIKPLKTGFHGILKKTLSRYRENACSFQDIPPKSQRYDRLLWICQRWVGHLAKTHPLQAIQLNKIDRTYDEEAILRDVYDVFSDLDTKDLKEIKLVFGMYLDDNCLHLLELALNKNFRLKCSFVAAKMVEEIITGNEAHELFYSKEEALHTLELGWERYSFRVIDYFLAHAEWGLAAQSALQTRDFNCLERCYHSLIQQGSEEGIDILFDELQDQVTEREEERGQLYLFLDLLLEKKKICAFVERAERVMDLKRQSLTERDIQCLSHWMCCLREAPQSQIVECLHRCRTELTRSIVRAAFFIRMMVAQKYDKALQCLIMIQGGLVYQGNAVRRFIFQSVSAQLAVLAEKKGCFFTDSPLFHCVLWMTYFLHGGEPSFKGSVKVPLEALRKIADKLEVSDEIESDVKTYQAVLNPHDELLHTSHFYVWDRLLRDGSMIPALFTHEEIYSLCTVLLRKEQLKWKFLPILLKHLDVSLLWKLIPYVENSVHHVGIPDQKEAFKICAASVANPEALTQEIKKLHRQHFIDICRMLPL